MGFTSEDVGSGVGDISIHFLGCHCTDDKFRGDVHLDFSPVPGLSLCLEGSCEIGLTLFF